VPTYVTDDEVLKAVARRIGVSADRMTADAPWWPEIVSEANEDAYEHVREAMVGQGYTVGQVDQWDYRSRWNRQVAVCYALRAAAVAKGYDETAIDKACKVLDDLEDVTLVINGAHVYPTAAVPQIAFGMGPGDPSQYDLTSDQLDVNAVQTAPTPDPTTM